MHVITLLGMGLVGKEFLKLIEDDADVHVPMIGVRDIEDKEWGDSIFSSQLEDIIDNDSINVVVEAISDTNTAKDIILYAISKKKNVVSCSKDVWILYKEELTKAAKENGVRLMLNSLVATAAKKKVLSYSLTEETILDTANDQIGKFRKADAVITAKAMYEDLKELPSRDSVEDE